MVCAACVYSARRVAQKNSLSQKQIIQIKHNIVKASTPRHKRALGWTRVYRQSWKKTAHASLATQSAGKSRLKQQIPNVKSITERWRYFVDFLHGFETFYFPKRFIYLRGIAFSGPYHWNFRKARDFVYFIDLLLCTVASRAAFSRHGLLTSR